MQTPQELASLVALMSSQDLARFMHSLVANIAFAENGKGGEGPKVRRDFARSLDESRKILPLPVYK